MQQSHPLHCQSAALAPSDLQPSRAAGRVTADGLLTGEPRAPLTNSRLNLKPETECFSRTGNGMKFHSSPKETSKEEIRQRRTAHALPSLFPASFPGPPFADVPLGPRQFVKACAGRIS